MGIGFAKSTLSLCLFIGCLYRFNQKQITLCSMHTHLVCGGSVSMLFYHSQNTLIFSSSSVHVETDKASQQYQAMHSKPMQSECGTHFSCGFLYFYNEKSNTINVQSAKECESSREIGVSEPRIMYNENLIQIDVNLI